MKEFKYFFKLGCIYNISKYITIKDRSVKKFIRKLYLNVVFLFHKKRFKHKITCDTKNATKAPLISVALCK